MKGVRPSFPSAIETSLIETAGGLSLSVIVMTADDVRSVREATDAPILVVHLEAINHCLEPRTAYASIPGVRAPADGETIAIG